jgi:tetratricopeptide (TPR) repeat protein
MKNDFMDNLRTMCLLIRAFRAHYSKGDYQKGLKLYQQIIDSGHRNISAYWGMSVCYWTLGDNEAAITAAKKALEIKSDYFKALQLLAKIYSEQEQDDLTYEYVSRALSNIPRWPADDEDDLPWISWATDFKKEYESKYPDKAQLLTRRIHSDAPESGA